MSRAALAEEVDVERQTISGIHHITAIAGDPQRNLDFYTDVLGLRLVKLTSTSMIPARITSTLATRRAHPDRS